MDAHLAELSRTIDAGELGRRIRAARVAAGMTQVELAAGEVTAAYVSRIEVGQRRPEAKLLERMAARMGTTAHQLLTQLTTHEARGLELQIEHAAIALALGDADGSLRAMRTTVRRLREFGDQALLSYARRIQAMAEYELGDVERAIDTLEVLAVPATADVNTLRALVALCRCYGELGKVDAAIAAGKRAEEIVHKLGMRGLADSVQLAAAMTSAYERAGVLLRASTTSRAALAEAGSETSGVAQAGLYWRASLAETESNGATPAAIELARSALALVQFDTARASVAYLEQMSIA